MKASQIVELLKVRHHEDIFVEQCKNGPTTSVGKGQLCIIDCWAMKRSWSNPLMTGYEIKVSRSDFINDNKWQRYLSLCNCFYFVCPHGLIQPEELPSHAGLMWVSKTGNRVFTKRKAPSRAVDQPIELLQYILICRAQIGREMSKEVKRQQQIEYWKTWLENKKDSQDIGYHCSREVRQRFDAMKDRARKAEKLEENLTEARKLLHEVFHVDPGNDFGHWKTFKEVFQEKLQQNGNSEELLKKLDQLNLIIAEMRKTIRGKT